MSSLLQYLDNNENNSVIPTVETKPTPTASNTDDTSLLQYLEVETPTSTKHLYNLLHH